jgi:hypothetical protein
METYRELAPLLEEFSQMELGDPGELPQIDLYMDQVITLLERNLKDFRRDQKDPLITGTMVNNYAKAKLLPAHNKKKYTGDHVLYLQVIYLLKQVLSTKDIGVLMAQVEREDFGTFYASAREAQRQAFLDLGEEVRTRCRRVEECSTEDPTLTLILGLAAEAWARKLLIERLLDSHYASNDGDRESGKR